MRRWAWPVTAMIVGAATGAVTHVYAVGALRRDAVFVGALVALMVWALRAARLRPRPPRRDATLTRAGRRALLILLALLSLLLGGLALVEARRGYPPLAPDALLADPPPSGFVTARGAPLIHRFYRVEGAEGRRFLYPLDPYGGRLVMIVAEPLAAPDPVVVTGRLRDDVRAVQRSEDGQMHGPFLPLYRAQMGLPPNARVLFLDTQARAGLNTLTLCALLASLSLWALTWGAATRKTL